MVSQVYAIFDPLGLMAPVTIIVKLLLQSLPIGNLPWDEPLQDEMLSQSIAALYSLVHAQVVSYPKSVKPEGPIGLLEICEWWDGGSPTSVFFV